MIGAQGGSAVLSNWLASRPGAPARAGVSVTSVRELNASILPENGVASNLTADELAKLLGVTYMSHSGAAVTPETAMRVTAVYGCVSLICAAIASLPFNIYQRDMEKMTRVDLGMKHPYWWFLNESANDEITTSTALAFLFGSRMFYGDGFGRWKRKNMFTNEVVGWEPLHPTRVQPFRDSNMKLWYRVTELNGTQNVHPPEDMIHIPSLGFDGLRSPSPLTYAAREAVGAALAQEEFTSRFFAQGSTHDIALKTAKNLTKEQSAVLAQSYATRYGGNRNNRSPLILTGGMEVEKLSITAQDAELLASRRFTVEEICRVFGVPPFMIGATEKSTSFGAGIEQMGIGFVKYTLQGQHLTPLQQEFNRKLWPSRQAVYCEFDVSELEKPSFKERMEGMRIAVGRAGEQGWVTPNEARDVMFLPEMDGGGKLAVPPVKAAPGAAPDPNAGGDGNEPAPPTNEPKKD
jgi:HK97 family phage portal protein